MTYQELGKYETHDQIEAAKYMASKEYVDANRIGIFGWSYGGFMSTLCITKGAEPLTGGEHGLQVLRVLEAAECSLREGSKAIRVGG